MSRRIDCLVGLLLLALGCGGGNGDGGMLGGGRTFLPDRAPAQGEFFLTGGAVHDRVMDVELHVLWPAGRGSLAVVFFYVKLPDGFALEDVTLGDGWPAWTGTPRIIHATGATPEGLWYFGVTPGVNAADETGNRCDPCPDPTEGDLHLATLTVRLGALGLPGRVELIPQEPEDSVTLFCQDATHGFNIMRPVTIGGVIQ